jgi:hypothetical protein
VTVTVCCNLSRTVAEKNIFNFLSGYASANTYRVEAQFDNDCESQSAIQAKNKIGSVHLPTLPNVEPATSTGRVASIWPEIEAALATGKSSGRCSMLPALMGWTFLILSFAFTCPGCVEQREKKQSAGFNYDPFSIQKQLID